MVLATTAAIAAPFLLPGMHERYFFLADVLTVVAAFYLPRRLWFLPLMIQTASLMSYVSFLFGTRPPGGYPVLAVVVLAAGVLAAYHLLRDLRPPPQPAPPVRQDEPAADEPDSGTPSAGDDVRTPPATADDPSRPEVPSLSKA